MAGVIDLTGRCQNSQHRLFSEHGRQQRYTDVDVLALSHTDTEMTVLRQTALSNIEVRHDLDSRDQRLVHTALQRYIIDDRAVDTHAHARAALKRLDMHIARAGADGTVKQAVEQLDDRRFRITAFAFFDLQHLHITLCKVLVGGLCRLLRADLGVIVANRALQRTHFTQADDHLTAGQLAHFLKGKVVERIVRHDLEALVRKADRKQVLLFRQLARNHADSGQIDLHLSDAHDLQSQTGSQCLDHLRLGDKAQLDQDLTDSLFTVLLLVGERLLHLLLRDVIALHQHFADTQIGFHASASLSLTHI